MTSKVRRTMAGLGAAALATGAMATTALAGGGANDSAKGVVTSPGVDIAFDAHSNASGGAEGHFIGNVKVGAQIMHAEGPVTCLSVKGKNIGVFYPVTSSSPKLMTQAKMGVYMNISTDGKGHAKSISYSTLPMKTQGGCEPAPTMIPAKGNVTSTDGG